MQAVAGLKYNVYLLSQASHAAGYICVCNGNIEDFFEGTSSLAQGIKVVHKNVPSTDALSAHVPAAQTRRLHRNPCPGL